MCVMASRFVFARFVAVLFTQDVCSRFIYMGRGVAVGYR